MLMPPPFEPPPPPPSQADLPYHLRRKTNRSMTMFLVTVLAFFVLMPVMTFALGKQQQYDYRSRAGYTDPDCPPNREYVCFGEKPDLRQRCAEDGTWNAYVCGNPNANCRYQRECELLP